MAGMRLSIPGFSAVVAATLLALPVGAARAVDARPTTVNEAQMAAQASREAADHYSSLGGAGYKAGLVQREEADAARYDRLAVELAAPDVTAAQMELERRADLEAYIEGASGPTYKSGNAQRAASQAVEQEPSIPAQTPNPSCMPTKPAVDVACNP
jgi:hypothetical protein